MRLLLCTFLVLTACNTPSPAFRGATSTRITVAGATFDIRQRGLHAEALRLNPQYAPRFGPLRAQAALAMTQATGCKVTKVKGDQALAIGTLDCGSGPPPAQLEPVDIECIPVRGSEIQELGQVRIELDCSPA